MKKRDKRQQKRPMPKPVPYVAGFFLSTVLAVLSTVLTTILAILTTVLPTTAIADTVDLGLHTAVGDARGASLLEVSGMFQTDYPGWSVRPYIGAFLSDPNAGGESVTTTTTTTTPPSCDKWKKKCKPTITTDVERKVPESVDLKTAAGVDAVWTRGRASVFGGVAMLMEDDNQFFDKSLQANVGAAYALSHGYHVVVRGFVGSGDGMALLGVTHAIGTIPK